MKVILLTDVPKVGNRYDIKELKDGFAQNVLIARGLAVLATPKELSLLESKKSKMAEIKKEESHDFNKLVKNLNGKEISIKVKANEKGHLFKAVGPRDVVSSIKESTGLDVSENDLVMNHHIKELGSHVLVIKKGGMKGEFKINIIK